MSTRRATRADIMRTRILFFTWLAGALAAGWWLGNALGGHLQLHLQLGARLGDQLHSRPQPTLLTGPPTASTWWAVLTGLTSAGWAVLLARASATIRPADPRARALPSWSRVRRHHGVWRLLHAGKWNRPHLGFWRRWAGTRPLTDYGYRLGRLGRHTLWAPFEERVQIVARTGWRKTTGLLIPIARRVPGPMLIGSTAADLFQATVTPREARGPVYVIDFSERAHRYAAGYPAFTWNPIGGCTDYAVAKRRARATVGGAQDPDSDSKENGYFRLAAGEVFTAWLHAAALAGLGMDKVMRWQADIHSAEPRDIIDLHSAAEPVAKMAMLKHLDERSSRTTSNTERFLQLALAPFATRDGAAFCAPHPGTPTLPELIEQTGTLYLLASPSTAAQVSPLVTLVADEWFYAARSVALSLPGNRLPVPAVGLLDELRALVPIPSLVEVVYEMRKFGIGLLYAVQNFAQLVELYGESGAESLMVNVAVTVVGNYDPGIAEQVVRRSAEVEVPVLTGRGLGPLHDFSESGTFRPVIDHGDLGDLTEGRGAILRNDCRPFFASFPRRPQRRIRREVTAVATRTAAAQATAAADRAAFEHLAAAAWARR